MRKVVFEGDTLALIRQFPTIVKQQAGYEIDRVQRNKDPGTWKPFSSIDKGVREIRIQEDGQFRIIYIAKFDDKVHVLHVFKKKSQKTRQLDIDIAKRRLKVVIKRYK